MTYEDFKNQLAGQEVKRTSVNWSEVALKDVAARVIAIRGSEIQLTYSAFNQFMKLVGMPTEFIDRLGELFSPEMAAKLANAIVGKLREKSGTFTLVFKMEKGKAKVVDLVGPNSKMVSNTTFHNIVEMLPDTLLDSVQGYSVNDTFGGSIDILLPEPITLEAPDGYDLVEGGLTFRTGMRLTQGLEGLTTVGYLERMVCTNGMYTPFEDVSFTLAGVETAAIKHFTGRLAASVDTGFIPKRLESTVKDAIRTPVSMREYNFLRKKAVTALNSLTGDVNEADKMAEKYFPLKKYDEAFVAALGQKEYTSKTSKELASLQTDQTMWSAYNAATYLTSHVVDSPRLAKTANDMFIKSNRWDFKPNVVNPFGSSWAANQQLGETLVPVLN